MRAENLDVDKIEIGLTDDLVTPGEIRKLGDFRQMPDLPDYEAKLERLADIRRLKKIMERMRVYDSVEVDVSSKYL